MRRTIITMLRRMGRDNGGAAAIEFVILAPALITMLIGVMQIGLYMQAQNALASVSTDMSRYMMIQYEKDNPISNSQLETLAFSRATSAPYLLQSNGLTTTVKNASSQTIPNVREIELELKYKVPSLMGFADVSLMDLSYKKSIYVTT